MSCNKTDIEIGKRIMELRKERGEKQKDLADAIGVNNRETINQWESGERKVKAEYVILLAKHFGVSADYLLGLSTTKSRDIDVNNACRVTGLSERVVIALMAWNANPSENGNLTQTFNSFLETAIFTPFFLSISDYTSVAKDNASLIESALCSYSAAKGAMSDDEFVTIRKDTLLKIRNAEEKVEFRRFMQIENFKEILDSVVPRINFYAHYNNIQQDITSDFEP